MNATVLHGDCVDVMRGMPDNSVDAVVCDPPYSYSFMSASWDQHATPLHFQQWCQEWATECLRVMKPGAFMLTFGGTRTFHRLTVGIEDAGFEVRDSIGWGAGVLAWVHGQGFPKGKGALKPAWEPIVCARKPLAKSTVAANVLAWGAGGINIDECRIQYASKADRDQTRVPIPIQHNDARGVYMSGTGVGRTGEVFEPAPAGRWPANVALDENMAAELDEQSGTLTSGKMKAGTARANTSGWGGPMPQETGSETHGDTGGASRFFPVFDVPFRYQAKAPPSERPSYMDADGRKVAHTTVKPVALMRWLVRLVTPPGGTVLDCFAGSGTTGEAAILEGFAVVLIEQEAEYLPLIEQRITRERS